MAGWVPLLGKDASSLSRWSFTRPFGDSIHSLRYAAKGTTTTEPGTLYIPGRVGKWTNLKTAKVDNYGKTRYNIELAIHGTVAENLKNFVTKCGPYPEPAAVEKLFKGDSISVRIELHKIQDSLPEHEETDLFPFVFDGAWFGSQPLDTDLPRSKFINQGDYVIVEAMMRAYGVNGNRGYSLELKTVFGMAEGELEVPEHLEVSRKRRRNE